MFNPHMEAAKRFASAFLGQWTQIGAGTGQLFDTRLCDPFTALAVSHTQGPGGGPFKQGVVGPQVQRRVVKERSEEHTSELQSLRHLVCRLLLEKKKKFMNY